MGLVTGFRACPRTRHVKSWVFAVLSLVIAENVRAETCTLAATTTPYVCGLRDAGAQPDEFPVYNADQAPASRMIVHGSSQNMPQRFGAFQHQVGKRVFSCTRPTATAQTPCPMPSWSGQFAASPASEATKTLVAIWSDTAAGWAATRVYVPNGDNTAAPISVSATPPAGFPTEITPAPIPGGSAFGGYFLLDVPAGATRSAAFTYRSSLPTLIRYRVYAKIATSVRIGTVNENRSVLKTTTGQNGFDMSTAVKPAIGVTSGATSSIAGSCAGPLVVSTLDGNGSVIDTTQANPVRLVPQATPGFIYLDPACAYPTETLGIQNPVPAPPGGQRPPSITSTREARFYFKVSGSYAQFPVSVQYFDTDNRSIFTTSQNQVVRAGQPIALKITAPGSVEQGACSSPLKIAFTDKFGNEASFTSSRQISLGGSQFYGAPDCSGSPATGFTVALGATSANIYIREPGSGTIKVSANSTGLQGSTADIRVLSNRILARAADLPSAQNMARRLYRRLTGTPLLDDVLLGQMSNLLLSGKALDAARLATQKDAFYNVILKQFFTKMSNRLEDPSEPLSDFVTTGIGLVRDNRDAREFLTGNRIYVGSQYSTTDANACANSVVYKSQFHYGVMERQRVNLAADLRPVRQCSYNSAQFEIDSPIPSSDTAGLVTTHKWGQQHVVAGTNRRPLEFILKQFNCLSMTQLSDNSVADWRVRRDVDRAPGNDPRTYTTSCRSCHALLDSGAGAFAFFDWYERPNSNGDDSRLFFMRGGYGGDAVMPKLNINGSTFPAGWISSDDSWALPLSQKQQALLQIDNGIPTSGNGVNSLGRALANSGSFRSCMASRAFELVCLREASSEDAGSISDLANYLADTGYNMRALIERAAVLGPCLGGGDVQ